MEAHADRAAFRARVCVSCGLQVLTAAEKDRLALDRKLQSAAYNEAARAGHDWLVSRGEGQGGPLQLLIPPRCACPLRCSPMLRSSCPRI